MFKEFSILWQQSDDEIRKFINEYGGLGIHQFKFRGPVVIPSGDFFYIERDTFMLRPIGEVEPIKRETADDIRLESKKMFSFISLNQVLKDKNAPKVKETMNDFLKVWNRPLLENPDIDDWILLDLTVPMELENIFSSLLTRIELIVKLERKSPELSEDKKRLYFKEQLGGLDIKPICLLAAIWYALICEISIKGHAVGFCHFCGNLFISKHKNTKTCCTEHQKALKQRAYRRVLGASDQLGRPRKDKTRKE